MGASLPPVSPARIRAQAGQGARFARVGDSLTANGASVSSTVATTTLDWLTWADIQNGGGIFANPVDNFAVIGKTSAQVITEQLSSVLAIASRIDFCTVLAGTNDIGRDNATPDSVIANLDAIYNTLLAANIRPVAMTILPRSDLSAFPARLQAIARINRWIRERARSTPAIVLIDPWSTLSDGAGGMVAAYTGDNLHLNSTGAQALGVGPVAAALSRIVPAQSPLWYDVSDTYDATANPTGNILANGQMTGTTGTASGIVSTSSGVATSWAWSSANGTLSTGAITASKGTRSDVFGANQRLTMASAFGTGATAVLVFEQVVTTTGKYIAGDVVEAVCDMATANGAAGIQSVELSMREYNTNGRFYKAMLGASGARISAVGFHGALRTPRCTVQSGTTNLSLRIVVTCDLTTVGGCNLVADIGLGCIRKVA